MIAVNTSDLQNLLSFREVMMRRSVAAAGLVLCASIGAAKADCAQLGNNITSLVCPLGAYNPNPITYTRPACLGTSSDDQKNAVQGAFSLAPSTVKEELCRLKQIFVLPVGDASWGLWENPLS